MANIYIKLISKLFHTGDMIIAVEVYDLKYPRQLLVCFFDPCCCFSVFLI